MCDFKGEKMIDNKEQFKDRENVYLILTALENALKTKDEFAVTVLISRLQQLKLKVVCIEDQSVVQ